jgi:hypothetical protein
VTEALIGIAGVAVGALLAAGATYWMAQRGERRAFRASARLLEHQLTLLDLRTTSGPTPASELERDSVADALNAFSLELWNDHQRPLAENLSKDDWTALSHAYVVIQLLKLRFERGRDYQPSPELVARMREGLAVLRRSAEVDEPRLHELLFR